MEITDVRVKLSSGGQPRLLAYCTITLDRCFVVRDVKVIQGNDGPFVAMPSRRPTQRCSSCRARNPLKGRYCSECGAPLHVDPSEGEGPAAMPTRMRFEAPAESLRVDVEVVDYTLNPDLPDEAFELSPPRGVTVESLD